MKAYLVGWNTKLLLKPLNQSSQVTDLSIGKSSPLTIPDQTDSD